MKVTYNNNLNYSVPHSSLTSSFSAQGRESPKAVNPERKVLNSVYSTSAQAKKEPNTSDVKEMEMDASCFQESKALQVLDSAFTNEPGRLV